MKIAYVFLNGELYSQKNFILQKLERDKGDIFCVDGGSRYLKEFDIVPLELWGDLDSTPLSIQKEWELKACKIYKFPVEKDFTDFELLLHSLEERNYDKITIFAGLGGNTDHLLANINLCFSFPKIEFLSEEEHIFLISKEKKYEFKNLANYSVSFVPMSSQIKKLSLKGFKYNLESRNVYRGESICHGNLIVEKYASISFEEGDVLVIVKNKLSQ